MNRLWTFFYKSKTFELISEGVADMHCLSDDYLAEELLIERNKQHQPRIPEGKET